MARKKRKKEGSSFAVSRVSVGDCFAIGVALEDGSDVRRCCKPQIRGEVNHSIVARERVERRLGFSPPSVALCGIPLSPTDSSSRGLPGVGFSLMARKKKKKIVLPGDGDWVMSAVSLGDGDGESSSPCPPRVRSPLPRVRRVSSFARMPRVRPFTRLRVWCRLDGSCWVSIHSKGILFDCFCLLFSRMVVGCSALGYFLV